MEGDFIWLRVLRSRANMTVPYSDDDVQSASSSRRIRILHPSGWAEERNRKRIRASDCLSQRRVRARPRFRRAPQAAPERSAGDPDHRVAFLLGTFLWRRKEKCLARRGETRLAGGTAEAQTCQGFTGSARPLVVVHHGFRIKSGVISVRHTSAINYIAICARRIRATTPKGSMKINPPEPRKPSPPSHTWPARFS